MTDLPSARARYHHGDLANALVAEATELAREGGPGAVVLREAARRAGVSATAAYRHFANLDALQAAVKAAAFAALGDAMKRRLAEVADRRDTQRRSLERFRAVGLGYVDFALANPGLFATAFSDAETPTTSPDRTADTDGPSPYDLLARALDELVESGHLPATRRDHAEVAAWSAVHGLAVLLLGPLRGLDVPAREAVTARTLDMVGRGL